MKSAIRYLSSVGRTGTCSRLLARMSMFVGRAFGQISLNGTHQSLQVIHSVADRGLGPHSATSRSHTPTLIREWRVPRDVILPMITTSEAKVRRPPPSVKRQVANKDGVWQRIGGGFDTKLFGGRESSAAGHCGLRCAQMLPPDKTQFSTLDREVAGRNLRPRTRRGRSSHRNRRRPSMLLS